MWVFGVTLATVAVMCTGCARDATDGSAEPVSTVIEANARMVRTVDGDTIVVDVAGTEERVRLIGINTPESVDRSRPVMCFGKEASAHMSELLPVGTPLQLVRDVEARDRYGRLLAYVYRATDGRFVNLAMVEDGFANHFTLAPNVEHTEQFRSAAGTARSNGVGLWSACEKPFEE